MDCRAGATDRTHMLSMHRPWFLIPCRGKCVGGRGAIFRQEIKDGGKDMEIKEGNKTYAS